MEIDWHPGDTTDSNTSDKTSGYSLPPLQTDRDIHEAIHGYLADLVDEETDLLESTTVLDLKLERRIRYSQRNPNSYITGVGDTRSLAVAHLG